MKKVFEQTDSDDEEGFPGLITSDDEDAASIDVLSDLGLPDSSDWPDHDFPEARQPQTVTAVRSFVGMTTYYSKYVVWHAAIAKPLYDMFQKDRSIEWTDKCAAAFQQLKDELISPPVLRQPDTSLPYLLHMDWSPIAIGAVLSQIGADGEEHPIAFGSRLLHGAERNYSATEGECLAVVHFIEHWRSFLHGAEFKVVTDHIALKWLMSTAHAGRLARWALKLQGLPFTIDHRPGAKHLNADALSRPPFATQDVPMISMFQHTSYSPDFAEDSPVRIGYADYSDLPEPDVGVMSEPDSLPETQQNDLTFADLPGGSLGSVEPQESPLSGPSVDADMPCEICGCSEDDAAMLLCDKCSKGFHTFCLQPALPEIPEGSWCCDLCCEASREITQDNATLDFLRDGNFPASADKTEKARIRARAQRYKFVGEQLHHKDTGKPIPPETDRLRIIQEVHAIGHTGIAKTFHMVSNHYWWRGMFEQVKSVLRNCRDCQLVQVSFNEPTEMHPVAIKGVYHKVGIDLIGPLQPVTV